MIPMNLRRKFYQYAFMKSDTRIFIKASTEKDKILELLIPTEKFHRNRFEVLFVSLDYVKKPQRVQKITTLL